MFKCAAFALQMACLRGAGGLLSNHIAKVRNKHCGSRILRKEIFHFSAIIFSDSVDVALVAVLQFSKGYFHTLKILLYLYINIELIFDFHRIYFGTATLQRCNNRNIDACLFLRKFTFPCSDLELPKLFCTFVLVNLRQ